MSWVWSRLTKPANVTSRSFNAKVSAMSGRSSVARQLVAAIDRRHRAHGAATQLSPYGLRRGMPRCSEIRPSSTGARTSVISLPVIVRTTASA